jgi:hypothetical protein
MQRATYRLAKLADQDQGGFYSETKEFKRVRSIMPYLEKNPDKKAFWLSGNGSHILKGDKIMATLRQFIETMNEKRRAKNERGNN